MELLSEVRKKEVRNAKVSYSVIKEKRIVVCYIEQGYMKFRGKAVCANEDVFDEIFGKNVAYCKAMMKMQLHINKMSKQWLEKNVSTVVRMSKLRDKSGYRYKSLKRILSNMMNVKE